MVVVNGGRMHKTLNLFFGGMLVISVAGLFRAFVAEQISDERAVNTGNEAVEWLTIDSSTCDLGTILSDSEHVASVRIFNNTNETLNIVQLRPGCGCLKVTARQTSLEPGGSTFVDGKLRAKSRAGKMGAGLDIELESISGERRRQSIFITANVVPAGGIASVPETVNFGGIHRGDTVRRTIELIVVSDSGENQNLEIVAPPAGISCALQRTGRTTKLDLAFDSSVADPRGLGKLQVRSSGDPSLFLDIPVLWRVKGAARAIPSAIIVPDSRGIVSGNAEVRFQCAGSELFRVRGTRITETSRSSGISVNAEILNDSTIIVHWDFTDQPATGFSGTIVADIEYLADDSQVQEVVTIPVVIRSKGISRAAFPDKE